MDINQMRDCFNTKISAIIRNKRNDNKSFLNSSEYAARVENVKESKMVLRTPGLKKNVKDYRIVTRYDVLSINGKERLIKPMNKTTKKAIYYATNEELFDILHTAHLAIGHGGRNRMVAKLKHQYANITKETIMAYLELCSECRKKSAHIKPGYVSKPILESCCNVGRQLNRWTVSQVETLIDQYKKYPVLYDPSHEDYSNTAVKNACLVNIVEALQTVRSGVTEADVTSQWNNLMVKYSQATQSQEPQFWYLHKLEFLQDHVGTTDVKLEDCDDEECDETNLFEPEITTKAHEWRDGIDPLESCVEVKEEIEDAPLAKKQKNEDEPVESGGLSEDESDVFGKFVASQLRKIVNEEVKQDTIFEIHKLLYKALKK